MHPRYGLAVCAYELCEYILAASADCNLHDIDGQL